MKYYCVLVVVILLVVGLVATEVWCSADVVVARGVVRVVLVGVLMSVVVS